MQTTVISDEAPRVLLVQPVDSHDLEEMAQEVDFIRSHCDIPFRLVAMHIKRWNEELTPWPAPPVFGKIPFGDGAARTLEAIRKIVNSHIPSLASAIVSEESERRGIVILGGYSLAGLFALWAGSQNPFDGVVAASPSVWYRDWLDYSAAHPMLAKHVYLSLGDREHRSKTPIMATVNDCIHRQLDILQRQGVDSTLVMNPGNHFQDNGKRTAMGFVWAMEAATKKR